MKFIITPTHESEIKACLDFGIADIFVDFECGISNAGALISPPNVFEDVSTFRKISAEINIFVRPDGQEIKNPEYLQKIMALEPDCIFFPNAEDPDYIREISGLFQKQGSKFISMVESPTGFNMLDKILQITSVDGIYLGLHDFSKSIGVDVFEPVQKGYLNELAHSAHNAKKSFGFTTLSQSLSDEMIFFLIKEHARLGSDMTLASTTRLKKIGNFNLVEAITHLTNIYNTSRRTASNNPPSAEL
jgi:HpcH/HpaI aldolase/citrate lyase family